MGLIKQTRQKFHSYLTDLETQKAIISGHIDSEWIESAIDDKLIYYSAEELQACLGLVENDIMHYTMFRTLAFTGLRRDELLALTWQDIDFQVSQLTVNKTVTTGHGYKYIIQPAKTKSSIRTISLDPITLSTLDRWKNYNAKSG